MGAMEYMMALPGGWTKVSPGEIAVLKSSPQVPFTPDRLTIPSTIGALFEVLDVTVDGASVLTSPPPLSADVFSELNHGANLKGALCRPTGVMAIKIKNVKEVAREFASVAIGTVLE
jgi:hypothetical protein